MPLKFLDDDRLYTDYVYYLRNFRWQASGPVGQTLLYHCYWGGTLTKHHELSERSVRCAHEITTITAWPHFVVLSRLGRRTSLLSMPIDIRCD